MIIWHSAQNNHITDLRNRLNISYQKFKPDEKSWTEIEKVTGKIDKYQEVASSRVDVASYTGIILADLPSEVLLQSITYKDRTISIEFKAQSVLSFTKLISKYLKEDTVETIELRSASLDTSNNIFTIEAGVIFK
jgi:hypothetical protein